MKKIYINMDNSIRYADQIEEFFKFLDKGLDIKAFYSGDKLDEYLDFKNFIMMTYERDFPISFLPQDKDLLSLFEDRLEEAKTAFAKLVYEDDLFLASYASAAGIELVLLEEKII
ncbi:hypothetical protein HMPREF3189_01486 [Clostridiales bacterium KA00134]|nr:hypothetical protein HMPREF3189_01486 [Clostridiales bacterium KA00134]